jgi:hypothetical protein
MAGCGIAKPAAERGMASRGALIKWVLDSDPPIWRQVMRDLTTERKATVTAERSRVAIDRWESGVTAASPDTNVFTTLKCSCPTRAADDIRTPSSSLFCIDALLRGRNPDFLQ